MAQEIRRGHVLSSPLFAAILLVALERFSEDAAILAHLANLQVKASKVGPETAPECARRAIWRTLFADDACIMW